VCTFWKIFADFEYNDPVQPFRVPVGSIALNLPQYFNVIKHPMNILTITRNIQAREHESTDAFGHDFDLTFQNCFFFKPAENEVHRRALLANQHTTAMFGQTDTRNSKQPVHDTTKPKTLSRNSESTQMPTRALKPES